MANDLSLTNQLALGKLLGGWALAGSVRLQSGLPVAVTQATNFNAFAGFGTERPHRAGDPQLPGGERTVARYFNTLAFQIAPPFTIGTSSRNPVRGPSYRAADFAIMKRAPIGERANLEFRAEFFNLTNTPPLGARHGVVGTPAFGSIGPALDPRVIQLAIKWSF